MQARQPTSFTSRGITQTPFFVTVTAEIISAWFFCKAKLCDRSNLSNPALLKNVPISSICQPAAYSIWKK